MGVAPFFGADVEWRGRGSCNSSTGRYARFAEALPTAGLPARTVSMSLGSSVSRLRTTQFLEQENKRLIRSPGRVPKAHLTGSVRRNVGLGRMRIQNGFDLAGRRDDEFGMQEASIPGRTAAGRADWHLDLIGQMRRDLLERQSQFQMRDRAGRVHGDPPEFPPDRQLRKQVATPRNRVDDGETLVLGLGLGVE